MSLSSLSLLVGDFVLPDDEHWLHFLTLLDMMDIIFAPDVT